MEVEATGERPDVKARIRQLEEFIRLARLAEAQMIEAYGCDEDAEVTQDLTDIRQYIEAREQELAELQPVQVS